MIKCLQDIIDSEDYQNHQSETLLNPQYHMINDTYVDVDNMIKCNENGDFGVSHADFIDCWAEYLSNLSLEETIDDKITAEIKAVANWHSENHSLDTII